MNIRFAPAPRSGTVVVEAENLSKSYGPVHVLKNVDFKIERGEKIAFVGRNGRVKRLFPELLSERQTIQGILK